MTKKGTDNMSAQVSMNDLDVRIVKPSDIKSEVIMLLIESVSIWGPPGIRKSEIDTITQERG